MATPLVDRSSPVPKGRWELKVDPGRFSVPDGPRSPGNAGLPTVSVKGGKLSVDTGSDVFRAAQDRGMTSLPVAMTSKAIQAAQRQGVLATGPSGSWQSGPDRVSAGAIILTVDLGEMMKVGNVFERAAAMLRGSGVKSITMAVNDGLRKLNTSLKRDLQQWTGIKTQREVGRAIKVHWAKNALLMMSGKIVISDTHRIITKENFGAEWKRGWPGARHRAWNRPQIARHSFMVAGKKPVFHRTSKSRFPIEPLWGPNMAREVERHRGEVQAQVDIAALHVRAEAARLLQLAISGGGPAR